MGRKRFRLNRDIRITAKVSYNLVWVDEFEDPKTDGECWFDDKIIAIRVGLSHRTTIEILVHEILHAVQHENKILLSHQTIYALQKPLATLVILNGWV